MLSRFAGESTLRSTAAKPSSNATSAIGSIARPNHRPDNSFARPVSLAATDNSRSDTELSPSAEFVQRHGCDHDDAEEDWLQTGVDGQKVERIAKDGQKQRTDGDDLDPADTAAQADPADPGGCDRL